MQKTNKYGMRKSMLLEETEEEIKLHSKLPSDVQWVGSTEFGWFMWSDFEELAKNIDTNDGRGGFVAEDLTIVGTDWWMVRIQSRLDGPDRWEYHALPTKPMYFSKPARLKSTKFAECCTLLWLNNADNMKQEAEEIRNMTLKGWNMDALRPLFGLTQKK